MRVRNACKLEVIGMAKKAVRIFVTAFIGAVCFCGCGRTDFSKDIVIVESDEPINVSGKTYISRREHYYYTFHTDGTLHLESFSKKYQFDGTWETDGDQMTMSSANADGKENVAVYTMKHGEEENSVVMVTEDGEKFLLTLQEETEKKS